MDSSCDARKKRRIKQGGKVRCDYPTLLADITHFAQPVDNANIAAIAIIL